MFDKAEYDVSKKLYHFRLTDQKTSGVGGAAPLAVDENLMQIMQQYYSVKLECINKYLTSKGLPPISTSILRVAYETTSHNSLNEDERKLVSSVLAHSSLQVINKHYVADTVEGQSRAQMALRKTQGLLLLKQDMMSNPDFYGRELKEEDVVKKFIRKREEHRVYETLLLPIESKVINVIKQIRSTYQTS
ncbi:BAG-associated GRAM protein 1 [Frankliniella fusca]|uniref:BAG-associated GRAM protein 1 n=1 Tax=Frankliniella fusca TaxID=407009 RepID=A0AAE1HXV6_9NEOP|nr:BAG-associated GRAM protein 1 [Frankliniella fusca]